MYWVYSGIYRKIQTMSTIFDPSKLNSDVNLEGDNTPKNPVVPSVNTKNNSSAELTDPLQQASNSTTPASKVETQDILGELSNTKKTANPKDLLPWEENDGKLSEIEQKQEPVAITEQKIIDINIASLEDIVSRIADKEYEYVLVEPEDSKVKITFRQDNIDREIKYIKYPVYTSILFKLKQTTDMVVEETGESQEWKGKISTERGKFLLAAKTAPGQNGERIWIKTKEDLNAWWKKQVKKTSMSMILGFLWTILLIGLILWATFIAFVVYSANDLEDVKFFVSLWINFNEINNFISQIVTVIFSILLFLCTAALSIWLFKFILTKKSLKRRKIIYGLISIFLLMITFGTGLAWMEIDRKINNLPNWQDKLYGNLKIYNNDLKNSNEFWEPESVLATTENLIGPITLLFDLKNFQEEERLKWFTVQKYIWDFGGETEESFGSTITKTFIQPGNYPITITAVGTDIQGETIERNIENIPSVSLSHKINIEETRTNSGWKKLSFDASELKTLGKVQWYFKEPISATNPNPKYPEWTKIDEGYEFIPGKIFFEETFVWISIINSDTVDPTIDKVLFIQTDGASEISGEIAFEQAIDDELEFTFFVKDPKTSFSDGFIETYEWSIWEKIYRENADIENPETSPKITHIFDNYWKHEIEVRLTDSKWKTQTLRRDITIQKRVQLRTPLIITDINGDNIESLRIEEKQHEYFVDEIGVPTTLKFDARLVRPASVLYTLDTVEWDIGNNGNIDTTGKSFNYEVPTEGNHTIRVSYSFTHRKKQDDIITLEEFIYIKWIKKDAILDLIMEYDSNYAPVTVRFDASKSFIKNDDIVKFIYDYGDGVIEERDAINPGHKYSEAWDYTVKLTVRGKTGRTYSTSKELILLPPPQWVSISTSLKRAPIGQEIDFSSAESEWQIVEYFWDFGDGNISTEANPSHSYKKSGDYTVKLRADFANNNSISDEVEVEITKE